MKKLLLLAIVAVAVLYLNRQPSEPVRATVEPPATPASEAGAIADADVDWQGGAQVTGEGTVTRILGDDTVGDHHQRFILTLDSGRTLLIAHNIDLAPRIDSLREGDTVSFSGEYESNDKGGVVHWTHHDPQGQHEAGWLKHHGRTYQ
jgi:hypothetical protein